MDLIEKINEMKAAMEQKIPPEALKIMNKATEDLKNSEIMDRILKTGDIAPEFALNDHLGNEVNSTALLEKGPLILSFYRGVW